MITNESLKFPNGKIADEYSILYLSFERDFTAILQRLNEYLIATDEGALLLQDILKACLSHYICPTDDSYNLHHFLDRMFGLCEMDWSPEDEQVVVSMVYEISNYIRLHFRDQLKELKQPYLDAEIGHLELKRNLGSMLLVVVYEADDYRDT